MSCKRGVESDSQRSSTKKVKVSNRNYEDESIIEQAESGINSDISEGEAGIIEQICLKNFMCHNRLDIKFGPNVNFIVGRNGSGKSAILMAIVIGLGGKATAANHRFIKNGKSFAEVTIKMRNSGSDAYRPKVYGDKIIIKRLLLADGGGSYNLESSSGELISDKRDELCHILEHFNIQVDNPVSILNQEVSQNFLQSRSPHDKYRFFLKATQLDEMERDYNESDEQHRIATYILEEKNQHLQELEKEVEVCRRKWIAHQSTDDLKAKLDRLKNEACWAHLAELETELEERSKALTQQQKQYTKCKQKVEVCQNQVIEETEKSQQAQAELQCHVKLEKFNQERTESRVRLEVERQKYHAAQLEVRGILSEIQFNKSDLKKKIKELRIRTMQEEIDSLELQLRTVHKQIDEHKNQYSTYMQDITKADIHISKLRQELNRFNLDITELKNIEEPEPIDVTTSEDELASLTARLTEFQEKETTAKETVLSCKATVEEIEKEFAEVENKIRSIMSSKIGLLREALLVADNNLDEAKRQLKYYKGQLKEHSKGVMELQKRRNVMQTRVEEAVAIAEKISPRMDTRRSARSIDNEIDQITERLKTEEGKQVSKFEVTKQYYEAKKQYEQISVDVQRGKESLDHIHTVMENRRKEYVNFRKLLSVRVRFLFVILLEQRQFTGQMEFDHEREMLFIVVYPGRTSEDISSFDPRGLSRGERSFTTVAFILALWHAMESPFRILDEFDAFMFQDMVTRRLSMEMMLESALTNTSHQYFFLTSLDMMTIKKSAKIKTFQLPDPDRNQTTLPDDCSASALTSEAETEDSD